MKSWINTETVRYPLAILAGIAWALAFPLPGWAALAWVAPALLWFGSLGLKRVEGFRFGYIAGLAHFLVLLRWMRHMPFPPGAYAAWISLSFYCALFPAAWVWIGSRLMGAGADTNSPAEVSISPSVAGRSFATWLASAKDYAHRPWVTRASLLLTLSMAWVALELIRSRFLSGFPWAPLGVTQWRQLPLIQIAAVTGVYGVSFLVCWCGLALGGAMITMGLRPESRWNWTAEARLPLAITLMIMGWGFWEVMTYRRIEARENTRRLTLALVQPSVPQTLLWDDEEQDRIFDKAMELSRQALAMQPDVLVWPEGSFGLSETNYLRMARLLSPDGPPWAFGTEDITREDGRIRRFNAAFLRKPDGSFGETYHKCRLVIFGEYVPLAKSLPFLKWLTPIGDGFDTGERPGKFEIKTNVIAAPIICFEDVFPHGIRDHVSPDVDFLLGFTNDGWFSESAAQWQQAANATFRAIENGVAMVRACNNGLTGWWDARGTSRDILGERTGNVYAPGVLLVSVPVGLPRVETPYHRHGDVFAGLCSALVAWRLVRGWRK
jgi:apolipoprotein N-acyltransferase